jgi:hypothetical protein
VTWAAISKMQKFSTQISIDDFISTVAKVLKVPTNRLDLLACDASQHTVHTAIEDERGYQPRQPLDLLPDIIKDMKLHPDLSARFEALQRLQCEIRESIDLNHEKMKQKHDKRRRPFGTLKAGDLECG